MNVSPFKVGWGDYTMDENKTPPEWRRNEHLVKNIVGKTLY